ncbi:MAG: glycosyltransferase family 39 protein [Acidobacteriota bacterium]
MAILVGIVVGFVAAVDLTRWIRPAVLLDPDPSWAAPRLFLSMVVCCGAALAGGLAAGAFLLWSRMPSASAPLSPLPLRRGAVTALAAAAIVAGAALRFAALARVPEVLWVDDLSLIRPALALRAAPADFADATRVVPFGVAKPYGSVGVLYLEGYRACLRLFGTTVFGVRFPSALAGAVSLVTAALLGRALLPEGGGALAALILAGIRWHLILSRWAWNMIVLAPIVDVATLLIVAARSRRSRTLAVAAGIVAGLGAHVYLSAWPAGAALGLFALWPQAQPERLVHRMARAAAFAAGFLLSVSPLFLFAQGRRAPYFARTADHNVALEMARTRSILPPFSAAADTFAAPWFLADPSARHDLPGRSRLGLLLGIPVAAAFSRALLRPRDGISALLWSHGIAVLAAVVAGGQADHPNGSRFAYLGSLAAVAAASGVLWIVGLWRREDRRHTAAIVAVGALSVGGALGARDALLRWPEDAQTFRSFHGQDTLIGRAAARWGEFGRLTIASGVGHSPLAIEPIRTFRLGQAPLAPRRPGGSAGFQIRIVSAASQPEASERVVERIQDPAGREWARVLAMRNGSL